MSYYPKPDFHIRNKVLLDLSNYVNKQKLEHATGVDISNFAAKGDFIALKSEVEKLYINILVNLPAGLNDLEIKVDDLDVGKLKTPPIDLKKFSDVVSKKVVKERVYNKLNTKVNSLEKKIPDGYTLIQTNQYNANKQNLERKIGAVENKIPVVTGLVTNTVLNTKMGEVENKIPDVSGLVKKTD